MRKHKKKKEKKKKTTAFVAQKKYLKNSTDFQVNFPTASSFLLEIKQFFRFHF